jgi:hypothetical protein
MSEENTERKSKSVTLYLDTEVIEALNAAAAVTNRSKSNAANHFIMHGIANYDFRASAPKKVAAPKKATKANTRVKPPAKVKTPAMPKTRGRKASAANDERTTTKRTTKRKPSASVAKQKAA